MTENNDFNEFLRKLNEEARKYMESNGSGSSLENNMPSPEDMQSMLNMFFGGMSNPNSGMPSNNNDFLSQLFQNISPNNNIQNNEEMSQMIENVLHDLQQNFEKLGLSNISGADADEMMRVLNELFSNIGQQKKNPLEDVDTSNIDEELEKLLKESVENSVNNEDKEGSTDNTDSKEKEVIDENVNNDNNEEEIDNNKPTRISLTNVKASFKNNKMIVESSVPEGFSNGLVNVSTSLENETLTISYSIDEKLFESVVRVRGLKNKGVVAFDKSASEIQLSDEKWIITVGLIDESDISFENDL